MEYWECDAEGTPVTGGSALQDAAISGSLALGTQIQLAAILEAYQDDITGFSYDHASLPGGGTSLTIQAPTIPGANVVKLYYTRNSYKVTYQYTNEPAGAPQLPTGGSAKFGETVTVDTNPVEVPGYNFSGWTPPTGVTVTDGKFTMPAAVTVTAEFEKITYKITIGTITGGTVTANPTNAVMGPSSLPS